MSLDHIAELGRLAGRCATALEVPVRQYADLVAATLAAGRTVFFAGNGGSAAHAQHIATEYVVRYLPVARRAAAAVALTCDSSLLTAVGNDIGFDEIFARQVEAHARAGDLVVLISTSGKSRNLLKAAEMARIIGARTVGLLAKDGGPLAKLVDLAIIVPTDDTAHAQEIQLALDHYVCSVVEPGLSA